MEFDGDARYCFVKNCIEYVIVPHYIVMWLLDNFSLVELQVNIYFIHIHISCDLWYKLQYIGDISICTSYTADIL